MLITDHSVNIHKGKHQTLTKEYILRLENNLGKSLINTVCFKSMR